MGWPFFLPDIERHPRKLLLLLVAIALVSMAVILSVTTAAIYRVYAAQVIASAEEDAVSVGKALLELEKRRLLHPDGAGGWRVSVEGEEMVKLDRRLRRFLNPFEISKIKVYDKEGRIVYSTDHTIIGKVDTENVRLARALTGVNDSKLEQKDKAFDLEGEEVFDVDVVETYVPIVAENGRIIGSFEIYRDVTRYRNEILRGVGSSVAVLALILVAVFGCSFAVVKVATRQIERSQEALRELATRDPLTGSLNRREVLKRACEELARLQRQGEGDGGLLGLIMLDLDHFKQVNDTHGHLAGDSVLREVSLRIQATLRPYDFAGRYGGEEFLVVVPGTDLEGTRRAAERIREIIRRLPFDFEGGSWRITASLGIAVTAGGEKEFSEALRRADDGLYLAKRQGRNRVCQIGEEGENAAETLHGGTHPVA